MKKDNKNIKKKNTIPLTKAQIIFSVIAILIGISALIGASYAVLKVTSRSDYKSTINTGNFQIDFTTGEVLNIKNMGPMSKSDGMNTDSFTFTITNSGTMDASYKVYLDENSETTTVPSTDYLMISYRTGDDAFSEPISIKDLYNSNTLALNKVLSKGKSITYEMKIWLDEDAGDEYQKTTYSARIVVESSQMVYDITTKEVEGNTYTLSNTLDMPLLGYKIYGNTVDNNSVGDLVSDGDYNGKYKIGVVSSTSSDSKGADIYLDEPLRKADDTHIDYVDFENLEVVRYTKIENDTVVSLSTPTVEKINLPYIYTFSEDTTLTVNTTVSPTKMEFKYFED